MKSPYGGVAIVGAYNTKQARRLEGVSELDLVRDAITGTLDSAGVRPDAARRLPLPFP